MFLHLNGASEIDAQPRVTGCETQKLARVFAHQQRAREEKVFRPARRANKREVRSAKRSESQCWMTKKKGAENIRRDRKSGACCRDTTVSCVCFRIARGARGHTLTNAGVTLKRRNGALEMHPGLAGDQQPRREKKASGTMKSAIQTETRQLNASRRQRALSTPLRLRGLYAAFSHAQTFLSSCTDFCPKTRSGPCCCCSNG